MIDRGADCNAIQTVGAPTRLLVFNLTAAAAASPIQISHSKAQRSNFNAQSSKPRLQPRLISLPCSTFYSITRFVRSSPRFHAPPPPPPKHLTHRSRNHRPSSSHQTRQLRLHHMPTKRLDSPPRYRLELGELCKSWHARSIS